MQRQNILFEYTLEYLRGILTFFKMFINTYLKTDQKYNLRSHKNKNKNKNTGHHILGKVISFQDVLLEIFKSRIISSFN